MMFVLPSRESELAKRIGKPLIAKGLNGYWLIWAGDNLFSGWATSFQGACIIARTYRRHERP